MIVGGTVGKSLPLIVAISKERFLTLDVNYKFIDMKYKINKHMYLGAGTI